MEAKREKRGARHMVAAVAQQLLDRHGTITSRALAEAAQVTRQAAHSHIQTLVRMGFLQKEGSGRATTYRRHHGTGWTACYRRTGLEEHRVWDELTAHAQQVRLLSQNAYEILHYALTEMVNNAIDHSQSETVCVEIGSHDGQVWFLVVDDGIGIFENVRQARNLATRVEALQELTKGKVTTQPDRHSGEGIFFTSKIADIFEIESGGLRWIVDNTRNDFSIEESPPAAGTKVRLQISPQKHKTLQELFDEYTDDFQFTKTRTLIKLFEFGVRFVSRSEAKRLLNGLEKFREVTLDFRGVQGIGQGFADEVFRVWAKEHPSVKLIPTEMAEPVAFMVERARHAGER